MKHVHRWIESLMGMLDKNVDEKTRIEVMEACGRRCIPQSFIRSAQACKEESKDNEDFLSRLGKTWKHLKKEGKKVYVIYEKCYCPLVKDHPEKLSPTFCNCSRGWIKELFESVLEGPVEVKMLTTIAKGDKICKFEVRL
jgi:predicted hydrocarbon binding protein